MSSDNKALSPIPLGQHNSASPSTNNKATGRRKRPTRLAYAPKESEAATSRDGQLKDDGSDPNGSEDDDSDDYSNDDDSDDDNDDDEQPKKKLKKTGKLACHFFHSIYLFSHY